MGGTFDPLVGRVLDGRYEILTKVARGGMATVYRARDQRLMRTVAVKVMRSDLGEDDEFTAKFDREARAAATISHPSVVGVFDQGISQGRPYIVMEYVDGETLRRVISREAPIQPARALELLEPVVRALACAHEHGLVHRDIKPENVLISSRGQVKVADFGLARLVQSPQLTATGVLVGTASYLPPELVLHSRPDSRSDVYSTGVLLFELLTGRKPHTGENNYQIAYRHVNVDIEPPSERLADLGHTMWRVPSHVDALVLACTVRDPQHRLTDGREMLAAVRKVRAALERDPWGDNLALTAELTPAAPPEATTQPIKPGPRPRPRPGATAVLAQPTLRPVQVAQRSPMSPNVHPSWPPIGATMQVPAVPVHPHSEDSFRRRGSSMAGRRPHSQRTPIHISKHPVYQRRRRGVALTLLVLLLAVAAGVWGWWWASHLTMPLIIAGLGDVVPDGDAPAGDMGAPCPPTAPH